MSHTPLQRELKKYFGFSEFKGLQEPVIENLVWQRHPGYYANRRR